MQKPTETASPSCHGMSGDYNLTVSSYSTQKRSAGVAIVQAPVFSANSRTKRWTLGTFAVVAFLVLACLQIESARAFPNLKETLIKRDGINRSDPSLDGVAKMSSAEVKEEELLHDDSPVFWLITFGAIAVVLLNGLVAGLTLGFMSLDTTNLQILATSGTEQEKQWAKRIIPIRQHGNLLLVTLLLCNTLMNETIPILADQVLPGGAITILVSTAAVFVFSEVLPQAICARHGLRVGAFFAWPVRILIYTLFVITWPISKALDWMLGKDEGVMYRRAELKELVAIHGDSHEGPLSKNEVTIIRGAMDLQDKTAASIMTGLENVFAIDINTMLDRAAMSSIVDAGHSRVPVYEGSIENIIGVVLIKSLIMLDPDDATPVRDVNINHLPKVHKSTPLYEMLDKFQEGSSHMAIVSNDADKKAPLGIVTLEDVIEELIQEEIVDETDVYVDVATKLRVVRALKSAAPSIRDVQTGVTSAAVSATGLSVTIGLPAMSPRSMNSMNSPISPLQPKRITSVVLPVLSPTSHATSSSPSAPKDRLQSPVFAAAPLTVNTHNLDAEIDSNSIIINNGNFYTTTVHRSNSWVSSYVRQASPSTPNNSSSQQLRGFAFSVNGRERHEKRKPSLKRPKSESTVVTTAYDEIRPEMTEIAHMSVSLDNCSTHTR